MADFFEIDDEEGDFLGFFEECEFSINYFDNESDILVLIVNIEDFLDFDLNEWEIDNEEEEVD